MERLPTARIGRSSHGAGGPLAGLWHWLWLPRVQTFRRCALCGCVRNEDYSRSGMGSGTHVCTGWMGEPYNRCMGAMTRSG